MIEAVVRRFTHSFPKGAALHEPAFLGNEWKYVKDCLDSGWVSSAGDYVSEFERELARLTGARHAIVTVNGTAALNTCLILSGVGPGDEVLVPALSFVATANAVSHTGATPYFCDCERQTFGIDAEKLDAHLRENCVIKSGICVNRRTGGKIRALIATHVFGQICDVESLATLAKKWSLVFIEDAAEALGSTYMGRHAGTFGAFGALSFNGNKIVTTGGGGAILTNDAGLAKRAKHITTTAKTPHAFEFIHDAVGYNYRLPNINAALGCAQLEQLSGFIEKKRALADYYRETLNDIDGIEVLSDFSGRKSNAWLIAALLSQNDKQLRDALIQALNEHKIQVRPVWQPLFQLPMYADHPRTDMDATKDLAYRLFCLPSGISSANLALAVNS